MLGLQINRAARWVETFLALALDEVRRGLLLQEALQIELVALLAVIRSTLLQDRNHRLVSLILTWMWYQQLQPIHFGVFKGGTKQTIATRPTAKYKTKVVPLVVPHLFYYAILL